MLAIEMPAGAMLASDMSATRRVALALCATLALVGVAGLPSVASAEISSGSGLVEELNKNQEKEETAAKTTSSATGTTGETESSSSISPSLLILALVAGGLLLGGIAFVILRDARSVAPVTENSAAGGGARDAQARMRKRRSKAKAARQQRKRNR